MATMAMVMTTMMMVMMLMTRTIMTVMMAVSLFMMIMVTMVTIVTVMVLVMMTVTLMPMVMATSTHCLSKVTTLKNQPTPRARTFSFETLAKANSSKTRPTQDLLTWGTRMG